MTVALVLAAVATLLRGPGAQGQTIAVPLGTAESFAVLAATTITNTGPTTIDGNVGLYPGTAVTGFGSVTLVPPSQLHVNNDVARIAKDDATTAYNSLQSQPCTADLSGKVLGQDVGTVNNPLGPGVYCFAAAAQLTGDLYLSGGGTYIFRIGSALTTASGSRVILQNGAQPCDVFWAVGSSATLGTNSQFVGTIIANTSITATTGAQVLGRLLALTGAVTLDTTRVVRPTCAATTTTAPPGATTTTTVPGATTTTVPPGATTTTVPPGATTTTAPGATTTTAPATTTTTTPGATTTTALPATTTTTAIPGTTITIPGTTIVVPGTTIVVPGTTIVVPGTTTVATTTTTLSTTTTLPTTTTTAIPATTTTTVQGTTTTLQPGGGGPGPGTTTTAPQATTTTGLAATTTTTAAPATTPTTISATTTTTVRPGTTGTTTPGVGTGLGAGGPDLLRAAGSGEALALTGPTHLQPMLVAALLAVLLGVMMLMSSGPGVGGLLVAAGPHGQRGGGDAGPARGRDLQHEAGAVQGAAPPPPPRARPQVPAESDLRRRDISPAEATRSALRAAESISWTLRLPEV